jgi:hypothetical protein
LDLVPQRHVLQELPLLVVLRILPIVILAPQVVFVLEVQPLFVLLVLSLPLVPLSVVPVPLVVSVEQDALHLLHVVVELTLYHQLALAQHVLWDLSV